MKAIKVSEKELLVRGKIAELEAALSKLPQGHYPVTHLFADGVYCREIFIPAGACIVGKIHRHDHFNFISRGRVTVVTKDGRATLEAPCFLISTAGTKRALVTHEDTVWTTIHANPTNERDLAKLEAMIIAPDYADIDEVAA